LPKIPDLLEESDQFTRDCTIKGKLKILVDIINLDEEKHKAIRASETFNKIIDLIKEEK